jgi:hypothetical protein
MYGSYALMNFVVGFQRMEDKVKDGLVLSVNLSWETIFRPV